MIEKPKHWCATLDTDFVCAAKELAALCRIFGRTNSGKCTVGNFLCPFHIPCHKVREKNWKEVLKEKTI